MEGGGGVEGGACPSSGSVPRASVEDRRRWDGMGGCKGVQSTGTIAAN